jgi:uncharacterized membrane protein (DUF373 family)
MTRKFKLLYPEKLRKINEVTTNLIWWVNGLAHIAITLALSIAVLMFIWLFVVDAYSAIVSQNFAHGFLHALGTLMVLWIVSSLITAEARYLQGESIGVDIFVEISLVVILRKLIVFPVQEIVPMPIEVATWVGSALALGVVYFLVLRAKPPLNSEIEDS